VGPAEDGGYVIREKALRSSDFLVGGGLSDDWRFEEDFEKRSGARVVIYDPTVNSKFWLKRLYGAIKGLRRGKSPFKVVKLYMAYNSFFSGETRQHIRKFIGELAPDMQIAHLHANNYGGHSPDGVPIALELTFSWASEITKPESPVPAYPVPDLDFPCNPAGVDPSIEFSAELRI